MCGGVSGRTDGVKTGAFENVWATLPAAMRTVSARLCVPSDGACRRSNELVWTSRCCHTRALP